MLDVVSLNHHAVYAFTVYVFQFFNVYVYCWVLCSSYGRGVHDSVGCYGGGLQT